MNITKAHLKEGSIVEGTGYVVGDLADNSFGSERNALSGKFYGVNSFIHYLQEHCSKPRHDGVSSRRKSVYDDENFTNFKTYEEAVDTFLNKPHTITNFAEYEKLTERSSRGNDIEFGVTGDSLDVGRFLEGEPECFATNTHGRLSARFATVIFGKTYNAGVGSKQIDQLNFEIVSLVNWMEMNNIRCSIEAWDICNIRNTQHVIKNFNDPLNITDVAVAANNDFQRRLLFRFSEYSKIWSSGYGDTRPCVRYLENWQNTENTLALVFGTDLPSVERIKARFREIREDLKQRIEDNNIIGTVKSFL